MCPVSGHYCSNGPPEDDEITDERPVFDVVQIESDRVIPFKGTPSTDLPEPCDAGLDQQSAMVVLIVECDFCIPLGPRPYQTHSSDEDVEQLRQFVKRIAP